MSDDPFQADDAATPLTPEDRLDLKLSYVALRRELNEAEALNVLAGERWALSRKRDALDEVFLRRLHLRMFGDVWRWAGKYRTSARNLGVDHWAIEVALRQALDDVRYWVEHKSYSPDEIVVRFHHKLVAIHPFPNGNGRWSRRLSARSRPPMLGTWRRCWRSLERNDERRASAFRFSSKPKRGRETLMAPPRARSSMAMVEYIMRALEKACVGNRGGNRNSQSMAGDGWSSEISAETPEA